MELLQKQKVFVHNTQIKSEMAVLRKHQTICGYLYDLHEEEIPDANEYYPKFIKTYYQKNPV